MYILVARSYDHSIIKENNAMTVTTFTLPHELATVAECDIYLAKCQKARDFLARMKPVGYTKATKAWDVRIAQAQARKEVLGG